MNENLIDAWDGFDTMVDAADVAAFDVECENVWSITDIDVAAMPNTMLALAHDDDGWWGCDTEYLPMTLDYLPANLPN